MDSGSEVVESAPHGLTRRAVLQQGGLLAIAIAVPAAGTAHVRPAMAAAAPARVVLTPGQAAVLDAIVERLVPSDASGPGGKEAGASAFIAKSLAGGLAGGLAELAGLYASGLNAVDAYAASAYGAAFAALAPDKQDAVLTDMQTGKATGFTPDSATFFATVREHTLEGMFCDPIYGGNKDFAGWDLIGYPGVRMPVPARYQKVGATVPRAHVSTYADGQFAAARKEALA
jgi:gluconate 2-dehydrogenase gamma chain